MITLVPESWGSVLMEHNDCHGKDDGRFCSDTGTTPGYDPARRLARLKTLLPETHKPRETSFLLPDGTRLRAVDAVGSRQPHETAIGKHGYTMSGLLSTLGVVRYVPHVGVEIGKPLTQKQAQMLADDWAEYGVSIVVDVTDKNFEVIKSREFHEPSASLLYDFSRHAYQPTRESHFGDAA